MSDSIIIGAALAHRYGYGGHAWALLQYITGFRDLGFEVTVVDRLEPGMTADPDRALSSFERLLTREGVTFSVLDQDGVPVSGLCRGTLLERTRRARLFFNVMGFVRDEELLAVARRRVFVDIDPGFGQVWRELGLADVFDGHDDFVTVGRNVGHPGCGVPPCGLRWVTMPHPVVLARCPVAAGGDSFTSVGSWRGPYGPVEYDGETLGLRVHEFRRFVELPHRVDARFTVALEIDEADDADLGLLGENDWHVVDPSDVAWDARDYLRFVQGSLAEFTVAKELYVKLRTGWLGDRTVCYLASGKPALVQDTGLADHYPLGMGLVAFSTLDEAADGAERILGDYATHAAAARELAETHFDSRVVLPRLLEELAA
jgi:hypothetical protein